MLLKIFILFSLLTLIPSILLFFILKIWKKRSKVRIYFWTPPIFIISWLLTLTFVANQSAVNKIETELGWAVMAYFMLIIPRFIYLTTLVISSPIRLFKKKIGKTVFYIALGLTIIAEGVLIYGMAYGRNKIQVKEFTYTSPRVPKAFNGYTIAQLSDLHAGGWFGDTEALLDLINRTNSLKADLIVFTGDLVNNRTVELEGLEGVLSQLNAPDGVYSILGNHDYGTYFRHWKDQQEMDENFNNLLQKQADIGWILLNNDHRMLYRANDSIALVGVENHGEPPFPQYADLHKALKGTGNSFKVLLSHNPTHWRSNVLPESDVDLMLAGHTHAMQLELFGYSPAVWKYKEWGGPYYEGSRCLYVNIGAGEIGIPFRFGAWSEITLITLKHEE